MDISKAAVPMIIALICMALASFISAEGMIAGKCREVGEFSVGNQVFECALRVKA